MSFQCIAAEAITKWPIERQHPKGVLELLSSFEKQSTVTGVDYLRERADSSGDDGRSPRERFDQCQPESLVGDRWNNGSKRVAEVRREIARSDASEKFHLGCCQSFQLVAIRSFSRYEQIYSGYRGEVRKNGL